MELLDISETLVTSYPTTILSHVRGSVTNNKVLDRTIEFVGAAITIKLPITITYNSSQSVTA
jgi:hypothetical protein